MREYLQLFRDQAFNGAFVLMKRVLLSNIIIAVILSIVSILLVVPLILKGIGWSFADLVGLKEKMESMSKNVTEPDDIRNFFMQMLGEINFGYLAIAMLVAILFSAYQYVVFFRLNDNTVRENNTGIVDALRMSFTSKVFSMIGLYLSLVAISALTFILFGILIGVLIALSKILGILIGFILFFVVLLFIIRFMISPAALIHGNMGIGAAISYSFNKITWKRAGILFLMGLVFMIAASMVSFTVSSITGAIFGFNNTNMTAIVISQVIAGALGAVLGAFLYCSLTSIYFRYSDDMRDDNAIEDHLIS